MMSFSDIREGAERFGKCFPSSVLVVLFITFSHKNDACTTLTRTLEKELTGNEGDVR